MKFSKLALTWIFFLERSILRNNPEWHRDRRGVKHQLQTFFKYLECSTGWSTSWNQDCWQKYQQPQICRWYHSNGIKWRGTEELLDEGERGEWKSGLRFNIQKMKIMASGPITSWQVDGEKWKWWQILFSWAPRSLRMVTAAIKLKYICSLEEKLWQT